MSAEEGRAGVQTQTFRSDGAGVKVVFQAQEIAGELYRVKPAVRRHVPAHDVLLQPPAFPQRM